MARLEVPTARTARTMVEKSIGQSSEKSRCRAQKHDPEALALTRRRRGSHRAGLAAPLGLSGRRFRPWSNREVAEQQSVGLWPLLGPLGAALDALCTLGARAKRGIERLLFAGSSRSSGKLKNPGIDLQNRCSID